MFKPAYAYLRVSGKSQIDGDGFPRQLDAVEKLAVEQKLVIEKTYREEGVSGATDWGDRPAFLEMVGAILDGEHVRTIVVENLTRLARHVRVQENILTYLAMKGIDLISADTGENITRAIREDPMKEAMIQMQAVFSQLEKKNLVRKLRTARERKKRETGKCEGVKPFGCFPGENDTLIEMRRLRSLGYTYRQISDMLNEHFETFPTRGGKPWSFPVCARILSRKM